MVVALKILPSGHRLCEGGNKMVGAAHARSIFFQNCLRFGISQYLILDSLCSQLFEIRDPFKKANCELQPNMGLMPNNPQSWMSNGSTKLVAVLKEDVPAGGELTINWGAWYWSQHCNFVKLSTDKLKKECMDFYRIKKVPAKL